MNIVELRVPTIGESISEVTLSQWLKKDGDFVERDEPICEFESDKATLEFPAEVSGKLIHVAREDDDLEIGALVAKIDTSVSASNGASGDKKGPDEKPSTEEQKEPAKEEVDVETVNEPESSKGGHPSPAAAKLMRENNISASEIRGSGKDGRITKEDVMTAIAQKGKNGSQKQEKKDEEKTQPVSTIKDSPAVKSTSTVRFGRTERSEKMSRMRKTIAKRLVSAKNQTAMLTTFNEADMTAILELRKKYQEKFVEKYGIKLGFMSIFAKACAKALMEMPDVNAKLDGEQIVYHDYVDISIAISTPNGLVVPPVHNVESLNYSEIENNIKELAGKARDGKLSLEEMSGGTFTITNGGIFGSLLSTPILNEPQSAILGMHNIVERPVAINGEVVIRPMMYLALSYDHRVIDGSTSVTFLVKVKQFLEDPLAMMLDI